MKNLFKKLVNKETVTYLLFGVLTTVVNLLVFKLVDMAFAGRFYLLTNIIAWVAAVAFAFITNKLFVFESKSLSPKVLGKEIAGFVTARLFSLGVEELGLFVLVTLLGMEEYILKIPMPFLASGSLDIGGKMCAKGIIAVVVVVMNYFFSKFFIFKNKEKSSEEAEKE